MISHIYFIRHAITEGNQKNWYYGQLDIPLAPEGFELIERLSGEGLYPPADGADCYTTGLIRTEQTFKAIYGNIPHEQITTLQEMNFGAWEGMSFEDIKAADTYRDKFAEWMSLGPDDTDFTFPEGESMRGFHERIKVGTKELVGKHRLKELSCRHNGKDAVSIMVCHGGVIASIMESFFPGAKETFWAWTVHPGHGYRVTFENSDPTRFEEF